MKQARTFFQRNAICRLTLLLAACLISVAGSAAATPVLNTATGCCYPGKPNNQNFNVNGVTVPGCDTPVTGVCNNAVLWGCTGGALTAQDSSSDNNYFKWQCYGNIATANCQKAKIIGTCGTSPGTCAYGTSQQVRQEGAEVDRWTCMSDGGTNTYQCGYNRPVSRTWQCQGDAGTTPVDCDNQGFIASWQTGNWGTCSGACGGGDGTQTRTVSCSTGNDANCDQATKPAVSQSCTNSTTCPVTGTWVWSGTDVCSATCGGGVLASAKTAVCSTGNVADCDPATKPAEAHAGDACNTQACEAGSCGTAANQAFGLLPSDSPYLCASGTMSDFHTTGNAYLWKCGTTQCSAGQHVGQACGSAVYTPTNTAPVFNLCNNATGIGVTDTGPGWRWNCQQSWTQGTNNGSGDQGGCFASKAAGG